MRLINDKNTASPFAIGKCKDNKPPKHVAVDGTTSEGVETRAVKINGEDATLYKSPKSAQYIYILLGAAWLWVKDESMFSTTQASFDNVPASEKPVKEKKEKAEKPAKPAKDTAEAIGLDLEAQYDVYGTQMKGSDAKKRFGLKNIKDGLASGKVKLIGEEVAEEAPVAEEAAG